MTFFNDDKYKHNPKSITKQRDDDRIISSDNSRGSKNIQCSYKIIQQTFDEDDSTRYKNNSAYNVSELRTIDQKVYTDINIRTHKSELNDYAIYLAVQILLRFKIFSLYLYVKSS
jgi:hypothetical protein